MEVTTTRHYNWLIVETLVLILVPLILILLPANYFDNGQSLCLSVQLFNKECFGCGITKSIMHLIHLDFRESFYHNPLGIIVSAIIGFIIIKRIRNNIIQLRTLHSRS